MHAEDDSASPAIKSTASLNANHPVGLLTLANCISRSGEGSCTNYRHVAHNFGASHDYVGDLRTGSYPDRDLRFSD